MWRGPITRRQKQVGSKDGKETLKLSVFVDFFSLARELFFLVVLFFLWVFLLFYAP
jgi:hypothetical protein